MRVRVARTSSRRVGLIVRSSVADPVPDSDVDGYPRTAHDELELAGKDLLEQFTASTGTPELQLGVVAGEKSNDNEVCTHKRLQILNPAPAAPIETVGNPQQCRELPQAGPVLGRERGEAGFRGFGVAPPVMADERGQERDLRGLEPAQLAVLDEVGGVAVVTLP